jgi:hypothetical protein
MTAERTVETECIEKIKARATVLMSNDPALPRSIAIAKAAESLPQTMSRYLQARSILGLRGVRPLPLE